MVLAGRLIGVVTLSALLLVLSMPLGELAYLAWFTFVPVLILCRGRGFLFGFSVGVALTFLAAWLSSTGWLYRSHDPSGELAWVYTGFGLFGIPVSLVLGLWAEPGTRKLRPWWFAAAATLLEILLFVQMPAHLALSQYRDPVVLKIASFGGIWMVSFLVWWANFWLAELAGSAGVSPARVASSARSVFKTPIYKAVTAALALAFVSVVTRYMRFPQSGPTEKFAAIQVEEPTEEGMALLQKQSSSDDTAFVVWPEFGGLAFPGPKALTKLSAKPGLAPFITTLRDDHMPLPHNVAILFDSGAASEPYAKRRLFGAENKMHAAGDKAVAVPYHGGQVGLAVCFDSTFPEIIRETARLPGVNVIALPSIDPPSPNHFIAAMHAAYTPFRCAEEGVAMVKADGLAWSQIVDPSGQIVAEAKPGDQILKGEVSITPQWTFYKLAGDWFLWVCGLLAVFGVVQVRRSK